MTGLHTTMLMLLQGEGQGQGGGGGSPFGGLTGMLFPLIIMFLIFYFLVIRPQNRERRNQAAMREALKKGDRVLTQGGVVAKIHTVRDDTITLDLDGSARMKVLRESIIRQLQEEGEKPASSS